MDVLPAREARAGDTCADAEIARVEGLGRRVITKVGEFRVAWHIWGSGPPVLLLHGGAGAWSHWIRNIEALAARYQVVAVDIPGHGGSDPVARTDAAPIAEVLWAGLDRILADAHPIPLVGFSFGGAIGGHMAQMRPGHVSRLVLVGSGGLRLTRPDTEPLRKWRSLTDPEEILEAHRQNLKTLMFRNPRSVDGLALHIQATNTRAARINSRVISRGMNLEELLAGCAISLAGIWGEDDATSRGYLAEREALIRRLDASAEFHVIPDAGHWVQFEAPDEFNSILLGMLGRQKSGRQMTKGVG